MDLDAAEGLEQLRPPCRWSPSLRTRVPGWRWKSRRQDLICSCSGSMSLDGSGRYTPLPCWSLAGSAPRRRATVTQMTTRDRTSQATPSRLRRRRDRAEMAADSGANTRPSARRTTPRSSREPAEVLRPRHVPLPLRGGPAHRSPGGLHGNRRGRAQAAHAGLQRPPPDGLGRLRAAGGACRGAREPAPTAHHRAERGQLPPSDRAPRLLVRLGAGGQHVLRGLLPLDAVDLPRAAQARPRLPGGRAGLVVSSVWARCSPTRRSRTAPTSIPATRSNGGRCGSGCSGSPPTRSGCSRTSTTSTGPSTSRRCSATGSASPTAPRSGCRSPAPTRASPSSRPGRTRCSAPPTACWRRSTRSFPGSRPANSAPPSTPTSTKRRTRPNSSAPTWRRTRPACSPAPAPRTRPPANRCRSGSPTTS